MIRAIRNNIPRFIIMIFIIILFIITLSLGISAKDLFNDLVTRLFMNGLLALSLLPMLRSGAGINFGLPIGAVAGLIGMVVSIETGMKNFTGFAAAIVILVPFAVVFGYLYGRLLGKVRGNEEIAATFAGFSFVSLMCFFWATAPFSHPQMMWPIGGKGLRPVIGLSNFFGKSLTDLWKFSPAGINIPLGLILLFSAIVIIMIIYSRSRRGIAMRATGQNEVFASLSGIDVSAVKTESVIYSTILAAAGICVYAQSYGFLELYEAPLMMAFPAASAILLGGGNGTGTTLMHAFLGMFLYQSIYLLSTPVANAILIPETAEILRMIISNGIILYALFAGSRVKDGTY